MASSLGYELMAMIFKIFDLLPWLISRINILLNTFMINAKDHHHDPRPDHMAIPWLGCNFLARLKLRSSKAFVAAGSLLVDETCDVAKAISNSNPNALLFSLQVQVHSAIDKATVCSYRRSVEDKLMGWLVILAVYAWWNNNRAVPVEKLAQFIGSRPQVQIKVSLELLNDIWGRWIFTRSIAFSRIQHMQEIGDARASFAVCLH